MLSRQEIEEMIGARDGEQEVLFESARRARARGIGDEVILRGVIEVTNICRVDCEYCPMRRSNTSANQHFVLSSEEIVSRSRLIRDAGINIILLQGGETPAALRAVEQAMPEICKLFDGRVEILLNLGCFDRETYARLRSVGGVSYIVKHETSDPELHRLMRFEELDLRLEALRDLKAEGFRVGSGLILGLPGQSLSSVIDDLELVSKLDLDMFSVSPFVPAPDTPLAHLEPGDINTALNIVACLRILHPHLLIPSVSAFEKVARDGQAGGLAAGANVLTINFSDSAIQEQYLIYGKDRFVVSLDHVKQIAGEAGLGTRGSIFLEPEGCETNDKPLCSLNSLESVASAGPVDQGH